MESTLDEVNAFYSFWYEFDSWREFSYLDEEEKERAENREERRWMEQQNRKMRQKRKKDEIQRIRTLVDTAYTHDPRLEKYKEEKKRKKEEEKRLKEEAVKEKERQRLQALEEERKQQEKLEQDAKEKAQKEKKEKDKIKKAIAKDRKTIRQFVKDNNYFTLEKEDIALMDRLEKTLENLSHERIQELKEITNKENIEKFKTMYTQYSDDVLETLKKKTRREAESFRRGTEQELKTEQPVGKSIGSTLDGTRGAATGESHHPVCNRDGIEMGCDRRVHQRTFRFDQEEDGKTCHQ